MGAALDYIRTGAHGAAVAAHYDPAKDPTGHTFVTGGGFFGWVASKAKALYDKVKDGITNIFNKVRSAITTDSLTE